MADQSPHLRPCLTYAAAATLDMPCLTPADLLAHGLVDCLCALYSPRPMDAARVRRHDELSLPDGPRAVVHRWTSRDWIYYQLEPGPNLIVARESVVQAYRYRDV